MPFISSFGWNSAVLTVTSTAGSAAVCNWFYKVMQTANFKKRIHSHPFSVVRYLDYEKSGSLAVKVCVTNSTNARWDTRSKRKSRIYNDLAVALELRALILLTEMFKKQSMLSLGIAIFQ